MQYKKIIYILIATVILGSILLSPLNHAKAQFGGAAEDPGATSPNPSPSDDTSWVLRAISWILYYGAFKPASFFMYFGAMVLDGSVDLAINSKMFKDMLDNPDSAVNAGWKISRDIVNLMLIFILLYIAIATILQLPKFGYKDLLVGVIMIAFLVNFSLVITKVVIDASNILAITFYNSFSPDGNKVDLAGAFENGLNTRKVWEQAKTFGKEQAQDDILWKMIISFIFGAAIMAIAGFVFLVMGILFIIRVVVLLILMAFSPLAFAANILPSTKTHFQKWWSMLLNQSFFAPAMLFMLWFAAKVVNSGFIKDALLGKQGGEMKTLYDAVDPASVSSAGASAAMPWENAALVINFLIVIVLLLASTFIAKSMSAYGAESAIKGLQQVGKRAQGYAGAFSKRWGGAIAQKMGEREIKDEQGRIIGTKQRWPSKIPLVGRGLARASVVHKEEIAKYEKDYNKYSDAALNTFMQGGPVGRLAMLNKGQKQAIKSILDKRAKEKAKKDMQKQAKEARKQRADQSKAIQEEAFKKGDILGIMMALLEEQRQIAESAEEAAETAEEALTKASTPPSPAAPPPTPKPPKT